MKITPLSLDGAYSIELSAHKDQRGSFTRLFCRRELRQIRPDLDFVQVNASRNEKKGTLRGLHYQLPPSSEAKLVGCIYGRCFDVIVDIRQDSPTFLEHVAVELSSENNRFVFVPEGFAHGFQTLSDDTRLIYFHSQYHDPDREAGILYTDPAVGIRWPVEDAIVSERDRAFKLLTESYQGVQLS